MELLLNLLWLTLAIPAIWVWLRQSLPGKRSHLVGGISAIILLGCVLLLLFPVVSASDDLHAMGTEIEESCPSKRIVKQASTQHPRVPITGDGALLVEAVHSTVNPQTEVQGRVFGLSVGTPLHAELCSFGGRAPPSSLFS
jgi:hypothetical protein